MVAGATVIVFIGLVLATVYSGQQGTLPGVGEESPDHGSPEVVTEGETFAYRWDDEEEHYELVVVDVRTGQQSDRIPEIALGSRPGMMFPVGLSKDGRLAATVSGDEVIESPQAGGTMLWPRVDLLTIIDTASGEVAEQPLPGDGWVPLSPPLRFSPDGETLALVYDRVEGATIMLFDTETAELKTERVIGERLGFMTFHPDGESLVIFSQEIGDESGVTEPPPPRIATLDAETLEIDWSKQVDGVATGWRCVENCDEPIQDRVTIGWNPGITMDPAGEHLYIAHPDQPVVDVIGLQDQSRTSVEYDITPDEPDDTDAHLGHIGYVMARLMPGSNDIYLLFGGANAFTIGLALVDLEAGSGSIRLTGNHAESGVPGEWIVVLPDGSGVILGAHGSLIRFDAEQETVQEEFSDWSAYPSLTLDGEPILLGSNDIDTSAPKLGVVDPDTLEVVAEWDPESGNYQWANLPGWALSLQD